MNIDPITRRKFIKTTGAAGVASLLANVPVVHGNHHSEKVKVGLIGLGGRGCGAGIINCAEADTNIELVAMGDLFKDHLDAAEARIKGNMERKKLPFDKIYKVKYENKFHGFNAYQNVIDSDVDLIILTTPPVFRPLHFRAAVDAGKHCFIEKPVAVDPKGIKHIIETSKIAEKKGLTVVAGTQMRRGRHFMALVDQVRSGAIGAIMSGQSTRLGGALSNWREHESVRRPEWSDMEWQLRRWLFCTWSSGDFIVEQHVHNLDIVDWIMGAHPVQVIGTGGRQSRTGPAYPNVWDTISVEYEYPNGARITHLGAQMDGISGRNDLVMHGTKGQLKSSFANASIAAEKSWEYEGATPNPAVAEYADTLESIRNSKGINEGAQIAQSTMTAILGRMAAYSGRALKWDWAMNASKLELTPKEWKFGEYPLKEVAVPGVNILI